MVFDAPWLKLESIGELQGLSPLVQRFRTDELANTRCHLRDEEDRCGRLDEVERPHAFLDVAGRQRVDELPRFWLGRSRNGLLDDTPRHRLLACVSEGKLRQLGIDVDRVLADKLDELEDVQNVYNTMDVTDEIAAALDED